MASNGDFYEILGVPRTATRDEIQRAYRKLARTYHPDVNKAPDAEERFKEVSEAYDVLSDPQTRRRYDAFGRDFRQVPEGVDPGTWARARAGAAAGGGLGQGFPGGFPGGFSGERSRGGEPGPGEEVWFSTGDGESINIEDLLGGMFRGPAGRAGRARGPVAGADQEAEIELTVEDAYRGGKRTITLSGPGGPRTYDVNIPAGVTDGQRIRLAGQGGQGTDGAAAGDLYLVVRIAPHPTYRIEGRDLHVELPLVPHEAALGATVSVDTPGGEAKVTVPAGTSTGRRLRLRGRGLPNPHGTPGDLYAETRIMVPPRLSDDERRAYEQLGRVSTFDPRRRS
jgi:curved DNA-binding protein